MADSAGSASRGGILTLASAGGSAVTQLLAFSILARVIEPADFGMVAIAASLLALAQTLLFMGLARAETRVVALSHNAQSSLFWVNVAVGSILAGMLALLAAILPPLYGEPELRGVLLAMSAAPFILGLHVQSRVALIRSERFGALAAAEFGASVLAAFFGVALALLGADYWALVAIPMVTAITVTATVVAIARWVPRRVGARSEVKSLVREGVQLFVSDFLQNMGRYLLVPTISLTVPAAQVGQFDRAQQVANLPVNSMLVKLQRVAIPVLGRTASDGPRFSRGWRQLERLITVVPFTLLLLLGALSEPVTRLILGPGWDLAGALLLPLAVVGAFRSVALGTNWALIARGESGRLVRLNSWAQPLMFGLAMLGLFWGVQGVAWAMVLGAVVYWPVQLLVAARATDGSFSAMFVDGASTVGFVGLPVAVGAWWASTAVDGALLSIAAGLTAAGGIAGLLWAVSPWHRKKFESVLGMVRAARRQT